MFARLVHHLVERINVTFDSEGMFVNLSHAMIMFGILVGGIIVLVALRALAKRLVFPRITGSYVNTGKKDAGGKPVYRQRRDTSMLAARHVLFEVLFLVAMFATFWVAAYTAGFNFFSSGYTTLAFGYLISFMFVFAMQNFGSGFWVNSGGAYQENDYISIPSQGAACHGFVSQKTAFHTVLRRMKEKGEGIGMLEIRVPNNIMMNSVVFEHYDREFSKQLEPLEVNDSDPDAYNRFSFVDSSAPAALHRRRVPHRMV